MSTVTAAAVRKVFLRFIGSGAVALAVGGVVFYLAYDNPPAGAWVPHLLTWTRTHATVPGATQIIDLISGSSPAQIAATAVTVTFGAMAALTRPKHHPPTEAERRAEVERILDQ